MSPKSKKIKTAAQQKEEAISNLENGLHDYLTRFEASVYICKETIKRIETLKQTQSEKEIAEISDYIRETARWLQWDAEGDPFYDSYEAHVEMLSGVAEGLLTIIDAKPRA